MDWTLIPHLSGTLISIVLMPVYFTYRNQCRVRMCYWHMFSLKPDYLIPVYFSSLTGSFLNETLVGTFPYPAVTQDSGSSERLLTYSVSLNTPTWIVFAVIQLWHASEIMPAKYNLQIIMQLCMYWQLLCFFFQIPFEEEYWRVGRIGQTATFFQLYSVLADVTELSFTAEFTEVCKFLLT